VRPDVAANLSVADSKDAYPMAPGKLPMIGPIVGSAVIIIALACVITISIFVYKKAVKPGFMGNPTVAADATTDFGSREADAVILEMRETGVTVKEYAEIELILEVRPEGEAPFRVKIAQAVYRFSVKNYQAGSRLKVRYDPKNLKRFTIVSAPAEKESAEKTIEHRLKKLEQLKEKGLVDEAEYQQKREEILNEL
jgi:hypothetical protein